MENIIYRICTFNQIFQEQEFSQYDSHWILWFAGVPFGMVRLKSRTIICVQTRQWYHIDDVKVSYVIHLDSLCLASTCMPDTQQNAQPFDMCVFVNKICVRCCLSMWYPNLTTLCKTLCFLLLNQLLFYDTDAWIFINKQPIALVLLISVCYSMYLTFLK